MKFYVKGQNKVPSPYSLTLYLFSRYSDPAWNNKPLQHSSVRQLRLQCVCMSESEKFYVAALTCNDSYLLTTQTRSAFVSAHVSSGKAHKLQCDTCLS